MIAKKQDQFVFYSVKVPKMRELIIIDGIIGTGLYYAIQIYTSSKVLGIIASIVGVTGIKQASVMWKSYTSK